MQYDPAAYGNRLGAEYDELYPADDLETQPAVAFLTAVALRHHDPSLMEMGIGTGRLALGVRENGLRVAGIEASEEMVKALRRKPGGADVPVAVGDYSTTRVEGQFSAVALVFNNILDSRGVSAQLQIFRNASDHLHDGGHFVVEAFVLSEEDRDGTWKVMPRYVGPDHVELQLARYDFTDGTLDRTLVHLRPDGSTFISVRDVYSSPRELDILAEVAGFDLVDRYSSWSGDPFVPGSRRHVSAYRKRDGVDAHGVPTEFP